MSENGVQRLMRQKAEAVELMKRLYVAANRQAWNDGESIDSVVHSMCRWMDINLSEHWSESLPVAEPYAQPLETIAERVCGTIAEDRQIVIRLEEGWGDVQVENPKTGEVLSCRHEDESFDDFVSRSIRKNN